MNYIKKKLEVYFTCCRYVHVGDIRPARMGTTLGYAAATVLILRVLALPSSEIISKRAHPAQRAALYPTITVAENVRIRRYPILCDVQ
jgi:hypothetical protein